MVEEFDLPLEIIDRRVTKMKMISPSNREVDVGKTLNDKEWIGMCRREVRGRRGAWRAQFGARLWCVGVWGALWTCGWAASGDGRGEAETPDSLQVAALTAAQRASASLSRWGPASEAGAANAQGRRRLKQ